MLIGLNNFLKPAGYKAGVTMQNIYKQKVAVSRIIQNGKVVIILFLPKVPVSTELDDNTGGWNPTFNRIYEMLIDMDFDHLKSLMEKLDLNHLDKLNSFASSLDENGIQNLKTLLQGFDESDIQKLKSLLQGLNVDRLKKVISVFDNDQVDKLEQILERFGTIDKLNKVLEKFDDNGDLIKVDIKTFKNPILTGISNINMESLEQLLFQLSDAVNGWNSIGFEKLQTAGIPITNIVILFISGVLFKKNKIPYLPYNSPSSPKNDEDIEMGNIELETLKVDFENLKAEVEKLRKSIKRKNHPGARNSEPDTE